MQDMQTPRHGLRLQCGQRQRETRCYEHATQEDISKRPEVYSDQYDEIPKKMHSEFDKGVFEDNFKELFEPDEYNATDYEEE